MLGATLFWLLQAAINGVDTSLLALTHLFIHIFTWSWQQILTILNPLVSIVPCLSDFMITVNLGK